MKLNVVLINVLILVVFLIKNKNVVCIIIDIELLIFVQLIFISSLIFLIFVEFVYIFCFLIIIVGGFIEELCERGFIIM